MPSFTDAEFARSRAAYVAKHGYTITLPGLSDIFLYNLETPITKQEETLYRAKKYVLFSPARLEEIRKMKAARKKRYLAMLASPSPDVARNLGALMTAFDDAQDALSTLAIVGLMASRVAPRFLGRLFAGPASWLLAVSEIINIHSYIRCMAMNKDAGKRLTERLANANPFTKKAKVRAARKLLKFAPTKGNLIEALQVTGDIFGIGISLGPIVGLIQDIVFGTALHALGKPVKIDFGLQDDIDRLKTTWEATKSFKSWAEYQKKSELTQWQRFRLSALKTISTATILWSSPWHTDEDDLLQAYMATLLAHQMIMPSFQDLNPMNELEGIQDIQIRAPRPWNVLTQEILEEEGHDLDDVCRWPWNRYRWTTIQDIMDHTAAPATANLNSYIERNKHNWKGFAAGSLATDTALYSLANIEGEEFVQYDYTVPAKAVMMIADANKRVSLVQPGEKIELLASWWQELEDNGQEIDLNGILVFFRDHHIVIEDVI